MVAKKTLEFQLNLQDEKYLRAIKNKNKKYSDTELYPTTSELI